MAGRALLSDDDDSKCELLGGFFAYFIQGLLLVAALLSLVYKRYVERPQRPWVVWALDVGKQLVGGFFVHFANIGVSELLRGVEGGNADECAFYFLNFFIDCTVGVAIVYCIHESICRAAAHLYGPSSVLSHIGMYGDPPVLKVWGIQLGAYLAALMLNKLIVATFLYVFLGPITAFGNWLFRPLQSNPKAELVVVMVLCPWLLQTLQFWLFDIFLKAKPSDVEHEYSGLVSKGEQRPRNDRGESREWTFGAL